uniref:Annexin A14 n=1 Tax=Gasterosteus aculeatus aculeatus TaxID=481459 RepID=A0AAQ4PHW7_GASAC
MTSATCKQTCVSGFLLCEECFYMILQVGCHSNSAGQWSGRSCEGALQRLLSCVIALQQAWHSQSGTEVQDDNRVVKRDLLYLHTFLQPPERSVSGRENKYFFKGTNVPMLFGHVFVGLLGFLVHHGKHLKSCNYQVTLSKCLIVFLFFGSVPRRVLFVYSICVYEQLISCSSNKTMDPEYFQSHNMSWGTLGTVRPFPNFHPEQDAREIRTALQNKDAVTVVRILTNRTNAQRQVIAQTFEEMTQKDLAVGVKKAMSGELEILLLELLMPPVQYEAFRLQQAMVGLGTDEETLLEILCTRSGEKLREISAMYKLLFKKDLEKELRGETSGDFSNLVLALKSLSSLYMCFIVFIQSLSASLNGKKADAALWINILTSRDSDHLNKVLDGLELQRGQTVDQTLDKKFTGDVRQGLKVLVQCIQNPGVYLAKRLVKAKVRWIMISHAEEDLLCIRAAYLKLTGTSLYTALQKQYKGDHLQALLALCRSED